MLYLQCLFDQSDEKESVLGDDAWYMITNLKLNQAACLINVYIKAILICGFCSVIWNSQII